MSDRISKTDAEWRAELDPETFRVTRQAGTERPFSHPGFPNGPGHYDCVCCGARLFDGDAKFESHCGWPSFSRAGGKIDEHRDISHATATCALFAPRRRATSSWAATIARPRGLRYF